MKRKSLFFIIGISLITISTVSYKGLELNSNYNVKAQEEKFEKPIVEIGATFMADFDNKQLLAGSVDYIFTGEVVDNLGQIDGYEYPTTQFKVRVNEQMQGELPSTELIIDQYGGVLTEEIEGEIIETLYLFEGDALVEKGKTYVFSANEQDYGSILLIPLYGNEEISDDTVKTDEILTEFEEAVEDPIVPEIQQRIDDLN